MFAARRGRSARWAAGAVAGIALAGVVPASGWAASGAERRAAAPTATPVEATAAARARLVRLAVSKVTVSDATPAAGQRFVVRGRVANRRGGRASAAHLQLTLTSGRNPATVYSLRGARIASVRPGSSRRFSVRVTAPALRAAVPKGFALRVCVRPGRGAPAAGCATATRRVRVSPRAVRPPQPPPAVRPDLTPPGRPGPGRPDPTVYSSGARTLGDSLFPTIGNGGYDVQRYDLDLSYTNVLTRVLRGTATIDAVATQNLSDFSLDFQGLAVSSVTVDGRAAAFGYDFDAAKLLVTPATGIRAGTAFTVAVVYGGAPGPVIDPDGSAEGWLSNIDFGAVALGEPLGSQGWFPVNNVPTDKARYAISVTVPDEFTAVSNGVLAGTTAHGDGTTTFDWAAEDPMAPYLATVSIGRFDASGSDLSDPARPFYLYVDQSFTRRAEIVADQQRAPEMLDWYAAYYGVPYPFDAAGGVVPRVGASVGYVLETQTKPTYPAADPADTGPGLATIAHENAHQWFGNLVTLARWRDIWLNEGITEFSSWLWEMEAEGGPPMADRFDGLYAGALGGFWQTPPADPPTAADIFDYAAMYLRGAMTMTAIREIFIATPGLGEPAFRAMMRSWLLDHAHGNVTTEQFVALVKATDPARADRWDEFVQQWLYTSYEGDPTQPGSKPDITPASF